MGETSTPIKKPKRFKWTIRIGIVVALYTVIGFFVVPAIIKSQMLKRLPPLTHRNAAVEQVKFNPYALSMTIRGFSLKETNGDVFASFDEFYINFQLWASLFHRALVFDEISLNHPFGQVIYNPDGSFNFANLLTNSVPATNAPPKKPQAMPAVMIYNLNITNGCVAFDDLDRKVAFRTQFQPIDLNLTNLTTIRDERSPYSFIVRDKEGEIFAWSGMVTVNPLRSAGEFRLGRLVLKKYSTYAQDFARFEVVDGKVDVTMDYRYDSLTNALDLSVSNTDVYLTDLKLKSPDTGEMVVAISNLSVTGTEASVANMKARAGLVKSSGGDILVRQNKDGTINLLSLLNLPTNAPASKKQMADASTNASPLPPLSAKIDEITFDNYTIKAEDQKPGKPASFKIDQLGFDVKNVSNASNAPVTASLSLRFQDTGSVAVNGMATLMPLSADIQIGVSNIDLRSLQPYVEQQIKLVITGGAVNVNGRARYSPSTPNAPLVSFTGDVAVNKFDTADDVLFKDFAKWDALGIKGIDFAMQPDHAHVEEIKFSGLSASMIVGPDHRANLQTILREQIAAKTNAANTNLSAASSAPATASTQSPIPTNLDVSLGALVFENASLHFADQSIEPHCSFDVQQFGGSIKGLSLKPDAIATVDFSGKVDDRSPFSVKGKLSPGEYDPSGKNLYADIAVAFTNTELTAFTPYSEKFAGYQLQKGKLSFGVHYDIDKMALKAENGFYIDQFTFGARTPNTNATGLPVKLGVALLKDRHGRIELDVPLSGRLDDPKFRVGPIIWQVVVNLLEKAATSPFSLLGAAFGGGEELSFVDFQPGLAMIPDAQTNKLNILAKALYERPELTLEINGSSDPTQDRMPLARAKFEQQIKSLWIKEQTDAGHPAFAIEDVKLDPKDHERLVTQVYVKTFGTNGIVAAVTNAPVAAITNAASQTSKPVTKTRVVSTEFERGATRLFASTEKPEETKTSKHAEAAVTNAAPAQSATATAGGLDSAEMETELVQKIDVSQDDFRDLMSRRAAAVQTFLLQTGKVTAERLFVTAPKPMNATSKGETKVTLSLD